LYSERARCGGGAVYQDRCWLLHFIRWEGKTEFLEKTLSNSGDTNA
jgi:hypothetical protein